MRNIEILLRSSKSFNRPPNQNDFQIVHCRNIRLIYNIFYDINLYQIFMKEYTESISNDVITGTMLNSDIQTVKNL